MDNNNNYDNDKLVINAYRPISDWRETVDDLTQKATKVFEDEPDVVDCVRDFHKFGHELLSFVRDYEFQGIQANGYWAHFKLACQLFEHGVNHFSSMSDHERKLYKHLLTTHRNGIEYLKILREDTKKQQSQRRDGNQGP